MYIYIYKYKWFFTRDPRNNVRLGGAPISIRCRLDRGDGGGCAVGKERKKEKTISTIFLFISASFFISLSTWKFYPRRVIIAFIRITCLIDVLMTFISSKEESSREMNTE